MRVVEQDAEIIAYTPNPLEVIELAGRTCYQSKSRGEPEQFVRNLIKNRHESVLEHASVTVRFIIDRGISHEIVRHRIASYSQESTRYCRYKDGIAVVRPGWVKTHEDRKFWLASSRRAEEDYLEALSRGYKPQEARSFLPHSTKTELVMTTNLRMWRHFFKERMAIVAHPDVRRVATTLLRKMRDLIPVVFEDIEDIASFEEKRTTP